MPTNLRTLLSFYNIFHFRIYECNTIQFFEIRQQQFSLLTHIKVQRPIFEALPCYLCYKNNFETIPQACSHTLSLSEKGGYLWPPLFLLNLFFGMKFELSQLLKFEFEILKRQKSKI